MDFDPSQREKTANDKVNELAEAGSRIPLSFMILMSGEPRLCKSLIFEDPNEIALIADYKKGRQRLFSLLKKFAGLNAVDNDRLRKAIEKTLEFLRKPDKEAQYILLEAGEIFAFEDIEFGDQANNLLADIKNVENTISELIKEAEETAKKREEYVFRLKLVDNIIFRIILLPFWLGRKKRKEVLSKALKDQDDDLLYDLGIEEWADYLYYSFDAGEDYKQDDFDGEVVK